MLDLQEVTEWLATLKERLANVCKWIVPFQVTVSVNISINISVSVSTNISVSVSIHISVRAPHDRMSRQKRHTHAGLINERDRP